MKSSRVPAACCDPEQIQSSTEKAPDVPTTVNSMLSRSRATNTTTSTSCRDSLPSISNRRGAPRTTWNMAGLQEAGLGREWEHRGLLLLVLRKVPWQTWVFCHLCRRGNRPGPEQLTVQINSGNACKQQKSLDFPCLSAHFLYNLNNSIFPITLWIKLCLPEICVWNWSHRIKQLPLMPSLLVSQTRDISFLPEWCGHHLSHYRLVSSNF